MHQLETQAKSHSNQYDLKNKWAIITGASRGIGKAIALTFAANGANLLLLSRNEKLLYKVKEEIQALNKSGSYEIVACDLKDTSNLISKIETVFGDKNGPDILINNAGLYAVDGLNHKNRMAWDETLSVNLTAAYELSCYASQSMMRKNWGRILNISSISADGEEFALSYSTAKAGLIGLTRSLALELAKFGVTVNAICPGWVETEMTINQLQDPTWCGLHNMDPKQSLEIARLSVPQERLLQAEEIAHLSAFLCSPEARGITGQSIKVCGGLSLI